jgi:hypothetical protein
MIPQTGMPDPLQLPQQIMLPPQEMSPHRSDMAIDLLGVKIPAELLNSGAFWAFLAITVMTVLLISYWKYKARNAD